MKKFILISILIAFVLPGMSQYSQNIENMSRKEIRAYLTSNEYSGKAKGHINLHIATKEIALAGYGISAILFFLTAIIDGLPADNSEKSSPNYTAPQIILVSSVSLTLLSEYSYSKAKELYKKESLINRNQNQSLRDESLILKSMVE